MGTFDDYMQTIERAAGKSKTAPPLEKTIQSAIIKRLRGVPGVWIFKATAGAFSRGGVPDIVGSYRGLFFGVEVKRPGVGRLSALQAKTHEQIRATGARVYIATSAADVDAILSDLECVRTCIETNGRGL